MTRNYDDIMKLAGNEEPSKYLVKRIVARIHREEKRLARWRFAALGSVALGSLSAIVPALLYLGKSVAASGFAQYLSLIFSDNGALLAYWKEMSFSLAESLPLFGIVVVLSVVTLFLWSTSRMIREAKIVFVPA